jgi:hypothetical protein
VPSTAINISISCCPTPRYHTLAATAAAAAAVTFLEQKHTMLLCCVLLSQALQALL